LKRKKKAIMVKNHSRRIDASWGKNENRQSLLEWKEKSYRMQERTGSRSKTGRCFTSKKKGIQVKKGFSEKNLLTFLNRFPLKGKVEMGDWVFLLKGKKGERGPGGGWKKT